MGLTIATEPAPIHVDAHGVARVGGTRVTLDLVTAAFLDGASAEEICMRYPALHLPAVYSAIGYYLNHREEVDEYLDRRQTEFERAKKQDEERWSPSGIREMLLSRWVQGRS